MEELFREQSKRIKIYLSNEIETDPFEKTKEITYLPPLAIDAVVSDLSFSKIQWTLQGITTNSAKELLVEKKNKSLLEQSSKIEIDGEDYEGYRINGKTAIKTEGEYIRVYIYLKQV
jgi:hypothetical protein